MLKPEVSPYFHIRDKITVQNGLLFKANRVLVPTPGYPKAYTRRSLGYPILSTQSP